MPSHYTTHSGVSQSKYFLASLSDCGVNFKAIEADKNSQYDLVGNSKKVFKAALVLYPDQ